MLRRTYRLAERLVLPGYRLVRGFVGRFTMTWRARRRPCRIVVGANGIFDRGWIPTDVEYLNLLRQEHWERYFVEGSIDSILAEHVWEHLTEAEGLDAAKRCFRYLKPGGTLRVAVPDALHPDPEYRSWVEPGRPGPGPKYHKSFYTYRSLRELFEHAGFEVECLEYFDESGEFHARDWDPASGMVHRSKRFDERNAAGTLRYTSIILDVRKPAHARTTSG